ncbi:hypothetical protein N665_0598s0002 [Sinapis alba]|nr:hypothetical protein N665_0598s0002 [Sinapis alba]
MVSTNVIFDEKKAWDWSSTTNKSYCEPIMLKLPDEGYIEESNDQDEDHEQEAIDQERKKKKKLRTTMQTKTVVNIGRKLGNIDTIELSEGHLLIDINSRKSLVFTKEIASPSGEEATIKFSYEKIFKHCSSCGMMTHELAQCPNKVLESSIKRGRMDVFSRIQQEMRDYHPHAQNDREGKHTMQAPFRYHNLGGRFNNLKHNNRRHSHRYAPYVTQRPQTWKAKEKHETLISAATSNQKSYAQRSSPLRIGHSRSTKASATPKTNKSTAPKITSKIVTLVRTLMEHDDNVTKRTRSVARDITFSPTERVFPDLEHIIEALIDTDMTATEMNKLDGNEIPLECDGDDLLGQDLLEL